MDNYMSNDIIIVDDEEDQVNKLRNKLFEIGLVSKGFVYDPLSILEQYNDIKILFMDLNLVPGPANDPMRFEKLSDAICQLVNEKHDPYILVFWTVNIEKVKSFIEYVNRDKNSEIFKRSPIYCATLDKAKFTTNPQREFDTLFSHPLVKLIFGYYRNIKKVGVKALNQILQNVYLSENWSKTDDLGNCLKVVLRKIAEVSQGKSHATENVDRSMNRVIGEELLYLLTNEQRTEWKDYLESEETNKIAEIPAGKNKEWLYRLNTIFNVDDQEYGKTDRGVVLELTEENIKDITGYSFDDWLKNIFEVTNSKVSTDNDDKYIPIAIEISAACDYAQENPRLCKYILGVYKKYGTVPSNCQREKLKSTKGRIPLPGFYLKGKFVLISLTSNYILGVNNKKMQNSVYLCRLKSDLINKILIDANSHSTRLGVIDFTES